MVVPCCVCGEKKGKWVGTLVRVSYAGAQRFFAKIQKIDTAD